MVTSEPGDRMVAPPALVVSLPVAPRQWRTCTDGLPILTQPPEAPATGAITGGATMRAWLPCCGALTLA